MAQAPERDFPIGHPAAIDTVLGSPEHLAWVEKHKFEENARDFPPGHPKAVDTKGNLNSMHVRAGVDPHNPHLEPFTGRTPAQAATWAKWHQEEAAGAHESPVMPVIDQAVLNAALAEERDRLDVDALSMEQTQAVMARLQHLALQPPKARTSIERTVTRYTKAEAQAMDDAGTWDPSWWPTTAKPWYGPAK
jgi:hypothetical protein